ncbi:MAG: C80 family cysteine peptidase [Coxiellaceae bacterium]|nr:C80 family cysteine peptidase [Coxiellaceae bacterium]
MRKRKIIICVGTDGKTANAAKDMLNKEKALYEIENSEEPLLIMLKPPPYEIDPTLKDCIQHPDSKVVVIGHGSSADVNFLHDDNKVKHSVSSIADKISFLTDKRTAAGEKHPLKVSLVSCFGGHRNYSTGESLAENLHLELFHNGCSTNITARKSLVVVSPGGRKATMSMSLVDKYAALERQRLTLASNDRKKANVTDKISRLTTGGNKVAYEQGSKVVIKSLPNQSMFGYRKDVVIHTRQARLDKVQHKIDRASVLLKKSWLKCVRADDDGDTNQALFNDTFLAVQHCRPESYAEIAGIIERQLENFVSKASLCDRITVPLFSTFYDEMQAVMKKLSALDSPKDTDEKCLSI